MANTSGEKELKTNWPHEEGLILGTTKLSSEPYLKPDESKVSERDKVGI